MFERINKRRLKLLKKLISRTRFNADLMRYVTNRLHILRLNRLHDTTIAYRSLDRSDWAERGI